MRIINIVPTSRWVRGSDLSWCSSVWLLCTAVTGGWVWGLIDMNSITGLLCLVAFCSHNTGRVFVWAATAAAAGDSADPSRQCPWEKKRITDNQKSILHLSEPLSQCTPHCSAFFVLHAQIWLVYQTMSGNRDGRPGPPRLLPPLNQTTDGSEACID